MKKSSLWTETGARLELVRGSQAGPWNWFFLPGGPGLGSEALLPLIEILSLPGMLWKLDLPGDGSNIQKDNARAISKWAKALEEAVSALENVVLVTHSRGGMFALAAPNLEPYLTGLVLMTSAPDMQWQKDLEKKIVHFPLPEADKEDLLYLQNPNNLQLKKCLVAGAPRMFASSDGLEKSADFFKQLPVNYEAWEWAKDHFDPTYEAKWVPKCPTLILSGKEDIAIPIQYFRAKKEYQQKNFLQKEIDKAGHFPWMDNPNEVKQVFKDFVAFLQQEEKSSLHR